MVTEENINGIDLGSVKGKRQKMEGERTTKGKVRGVNIFF